MRKSHFLSIFLIALLIVGLAYGLSTFLTITNRGVVKAVGISIYEDALCENSLMMIDWGMVNPDSTVTYDGWLRNEGNVAVTVNMFVENLIPLNATQFMVLTWNREGAMVGVNETVSCVFTLHIFSNVSITDFSFNIVLVGSEL